jgi:hypothetical protein
MNTIIFGIYVVFGSMAGLAHSWCFSYVYDQLDFEKNKYLSLRQIRRDKLRVWLAWSGSIIFSVLVYAPPINRIFFSTRHSSLNPSCIKLFPRHLILWAAHQNPSARWQSFL